MTTSRITSGELSNQRNGSGGGFGLDNRAMPSGVGEGRYQPITPWYRLG